MWTSFSHRLAVLALALGVGLAAGGACAATPAQLGPPVAPPQGRLVVVNPTGDSYTVSAGGESTGTVAPGASITLNAVGAGQVAVLAQSDRLQLAQRQVVTLPAGGEVTVTLVAQYARLRIVNPRAEPVEILIDGVSVGWAAPEADTVLEPVPAGKRTLVARPGSGPGAVRVERFLAEGEQARWAVPPLTAGGGVSEAPRPPAGKGLVWMRNVSARDVRVFMGDEELAFVAAGATAEIVVEPGTYTLHVKLEEVDTASEHTVTLLPNQTAEWEYSGSL